MPSKKYNVTVKKPKKYNITLKKPTKPRRIDPRRVG